MWHLAYVATCVECPGRATHASDTTHVRPGMGGRKTPETQGAENFDGWQDKMQNFGKKRVA